MSLTKEQLRKELDDTNRYPNVDSIKIAAESQLTNKEMKLKTRERIINIILKKNEEDKAIASLGR